MKVDTSRIPRIDCSTCIRPYPESPYIPLNEYTIDIFGTTLPLRRDKAGNVYYEKVLEEYPHKMTLSEVEQKLGHKIELVSDK